MMRLVWLFALCLALSACQAHDNYESRGLIDSNGYFADVSGGYDQESKQSQQAAPQSVGEQSSFQRFMAYRYNYGYELPAKSVTTTANKHMQICLDAGPAKCEVIHSNMQSQSEAYVSAYLSIRGEPKWLETYKQSISKSVEEAKGKLSSSSVDAEDLTREILDTDARLKAKKGLRDRLETLLETRDGELADLLAVERELARVQGEIESINSNLRVLETRVKKSIVNISYDSKSVAVDRGTFGPVTRAFKNFFENFAWALGAVITFFAAILPWLILVIIPLIWLIRWLWRRWRRESKPRKAKS